MSEGTMSEGTMSEVKLLGFEQLSYSAGPQSLDDRYDCRVPRRTEMKVRDILRGG